MEAFRMAENAKHSARANTHDGIMIIYKTVGK